MRTTKRKKKYKHLFDYLTRRIMSGTPCDNTLRLTHAFADKNDLFFGELSQILEEMDGHCDCEVLLNVDGRIPDDEVIGEETFQTPKQRALERGWYCRCDDEGKYVPCSEKDDDAILDLNRAAESIAQESGK